MPMPKNINLLLLFTQVYVTQILQSQQLRKSRRPNINMYTSDYFFGMLK